jgi:hypothetical protein
VGSSPTTISRASASEGAGSEHAPSRAAAPTASSSDVGCRQLTMLLIIIINFKVKIPSHLIDDLYRARVFISALNEPFYATELW